MLEDEVKCVQEAEHGDAASIKNLSSQTGVSRDTARKHYHDAGRNYAKAYDSLSKHVMQEAGSDGPPYRHDTEITSDHIKSHLDAGSKHGKIGFVFISKHKTAAGKPFEMNSITGHGRESVGVKVNGKHYFKPSDLKKDHPDIHDTVKPREGWKY